MSDVKHWRQLVNTDYIGSWDLNGDTAVTIQSVTNKIAKNPEGKEELVITIQLAEFKKPWICNRVNAKSISKALGSSNPSDWKGRQVTLYSTQVKAFGDVVDAIRVRQVAPSAPIDPTDAIKRIGMANSLDELKTIWSRLSKPEQGHPDVVRAKDARKTEVEKGGGR